MNGTRREGLSIGKRVFLVVLIVVLLLIVPLGRGMMFVVNEREVAVVRQFGEPVRWYTEPGLYFKVPFVQKVRRLPKTYQFWTAAGGQIVVDLPTADGKKLEVTPWAVWKITDPVRFVEVLRTMEKAEKRVQDAVRSAVRDVITGNKLVEAVRSSDRELTYTLVESLEGQAPEGQEPAGQEPTDEAQPEAPSLRPEERIAGRRKEIVQEITTIALERLAKTEQGDPFDRGIELVDVGISKIEFVEKVRQAAFERLIAFYESIASKYDNEGKRTKQEILNQTEADVQKILGEGKQKANTIRGEVDAEIIDAYAKAINETGGFYNFIRTLEAYKESLGSNTRLILTTDSGLLRLLQEMPPADAEAPPQRGPSNDSPPSDGT